MVNELTQSFPMTGSDPVFWAPPGLLSSYPPSDKAKKLVSIYEERINRKK
jgi:hypothetical protein